MKTKFESMPGYEFTDEEIADLVVETVRHNQQTHRDMAESFAKIAAHYQADPIQLIASHVVSLTMIANGASDPRVSIDGVIRALQVRRAVFEGQIEDPTVN